ncbi:hypothetical protein HBDW_35730 [Herbaspirillum sp. DW155]|uniref:hypothetical protein n=1 Tax=Herbaspirillum sp. DW155 TaxID=3095609 RepID=UPI00308C522B|nr:hypothetical protein HBDW_35730 [Herbaspirillum sp. DW155]
MKTKLLTLLDKTLDALPMTGAAIGLTLLACIFSGVLRDILLRADLDMLAAAVAILPLTTVLLAFGWAMRDKPRKPRQSRWQRQQELERRKALLRATYDLDERR